MWTSNFDCITGPCTSDLAISNYHHPQHTYTHTHTSAAAAAAAAAASSSSSELGPSHGENYADTTRGLPSCY